MIWFILTLGLTLRLIGLNQSLWLDEATQVLLSHDSINQIIFNHGPDFHPPFSYILLHFWMKISTSEIWFRLLSVIWGLLAILFTYKISKLLFNKRVAIISAFLLAIGPYHIYYSQEVRMYTLATFLTTASMYFFFSLLKDNYLKIKIWYVILSILLLYTHYYGFFVIFTQIVYLVFYKIKDFRKVLFPILVILFWLPWIPQFLIQLKGGISTQHYLPGWGKILSLEPVIALPLTLFKFSMGRIDFYDMRLYVAIVFFVLLLICFLLIRSLREIKNEKYGFIILWFYIPLMSAFTISFYIPINQPFRLLFIIPAFYILLALGILSLKRFFRITLFGLILISIMGISLYYFDQKFRREDWRGAIQFVDQRVGSKGIILFAWPAPFPPYELYTKKKLGLGIVSKFPAEKEEVIKRLSLQEKNEVFLFEYLQALSDPNKIIQQILLDNNFQQRQIYNFNGVGFVYYYVKE